VTPPELIAFERANPSPFLRLRLLHLPANPGRLPPVARDRLRVLMIQSERVGPPPQWDEPDQPEPPRRRRNTLPCLFVVFALSAFTALATIGIYRVVMWIVHL
jgi:hypothetical protein